MWNFDFLLDLIGCGLVYPVGARCQTPCRLSLCRWQVFLDMDYWQGIALGYSGANAVRASLSSRSKLRSQPLMNRPHRCTHAYMCFYLFSHSDAFSWRKIRTRLRLSSRHRSGLVYACMHGFPVKVLPHTLNVGNGGEISRRRPKRSAILTVMLEARSHLDAGRWAGEMAFLSFLSSE